MICIHGLAAAAAFLAVPGAGAILLALLVVLLGVYAAWDRALLRSGHALRAIALAPSGEAVVELANGQILHACIGARRHVTRFWVALSLSGELRRPVLLTGDMMDAQSFRFLRLWALWGRWPDAPAPRVPAGPAGRAN